MFERKKLKFPCYAAFGNGIDEWVIDILYGGGKVKTIKRFNVSKKVRKIMDHPDYDKERHRHRWYKYYSLAHQAATKEIERLRREEPL